VEGREVYGSLCASCHTADGSGGRGPALNQGRVVEAYPDVEDQIELVTNGRAAMPAFSGSLSADEIAAVVRYTREVIATVE
ncbi:MAG: cytochrome c, partial [Actinomycetota bacterium]|nr:cytochrome c [Actinomycetota bacterium]